MMPLDKLQYLFYELNSDESLTSLAAVLGTTYADQTIRIPAQHGNGLIRKFQLEEGLDMRIIDLQLTKPLLINKATDSRREKYFHILWLINPEVAEVRMNDIINESNRLEKLNIILMSNDVEIRAELITSGQLKGVDISFTGTWLQQSFSDAGDALKSSISRLLQNTNPTVYFERTTASDYRMLAQLIDAGIGHAQDNLFLRAGALSLLAGFFNKCHPSIEHGNHDAHFFYYEKMLQVEKYLNAHLQKSLPSIDIIARELALSESSLKRHFKQMFGKSIYEYYLELKMDFAKRLLLEKPLSVNEVAIMLDYERVSSFIDIFKRHHGIPPGALRRKAEPRILPR